MKKIKDKKTYFTIVISIIIILLIVIACIKLLPFILSLKDETTRINFENYIDGLGVKGVLLVLLIQILQVFIAFIPGEIVELLAGFLYGTWGGLAICLLGNLIASLLIFSLVKFLAKNHLNNFQDKLKQYSFLNNKKKIALYLFIIYLIPGLPKDIFNYLAPFLPINFWIFILVTSIARIPSIISSTYSSYSILNSNYTMAIIISIIFAVLAILGVIYKNKIMAFLKKDNEKQENM